MRHRNALKKLGRNSSHRRALLRNLSTALFLHERLETTLAKAKALRPFADRLITLARRGDLHARRRAAQEIHDHEVLGKLFGDIAERSKARPGGYTRVLKLGVRKGDNGDCALVELVDRAAKKEAGPAVEAT